MENFDYLPKLHRCAMLIANEIRRVCEKNGIRHFVIAGTLLGAVRHKGFIPWDDDMDIGMLREDYERFLVAAQRDLDDRFYLQTTQTDGAYGLNFAKVLLKDTVLREGTGSASTENGIYVDVFPFDAVPEDEAQRIRHKRKTYFLKRLLLAKQNYMVGGKKNYGKRLAYLGLKCIAAFYSHDGLCAKLEDTCRMYNDPGKLPERIVNIGGAYGYDKETILRKWVDDTVELPFEEFTVYAPAGYVPYLEYFYGDYMTPPPENKRYNRHSVEKIDFGPYD